LAKEAILGKLSRDLAFLYFDYDRFHVNLTQEQDAPAAEDGRALLDPLQRGRRGGGDVDRISLQRHLELAAKSNDPRERARKTRIGAVVSALAAASLDIADMISLGALAAPANGVARGFDIRAHETLAQGLRGADVRAFISTEADETLAIDESGAFAVEASPLFGANNLDANRTAGTVFAITEASKEGALPAGDPLAAGFVVYSHQTVLALTLGDGVDIFTHDRRDRSWGLTAAGVRIPDFAHEYAVNAANYRHWNASVRAFVDDCFNSGDSDGERDFNSRWTGSLVADAFHILVRGGVLFDPADARRGHEDGRLRLLCEARPIAYVIEQAGGRASTGCARILDLPATSPHARTPLILGSRPMVERIERLHSRPESLADVSPLFGKRGLFRA
jgi:fructose-1,6-bisphosphatase I